jgi:hypothetical protein
LKISQNTIFLVRAFGTAISCNRQGFIEAFISEDSDTIAFGAACVMRTSGFVRFTHYLDNKIHLTANCSTEGAKEKITVLAKF